MIDKLIETYVALRDKKAQMKAEYEASVAPIQQALDRAEAELLRAMQEQGTTALKTPFGTAYQSKRTSATVADWDQLLSYVQQNSLWTMLERRVNKTAVDEFVEANNDLPPGVNYRTELTVGVRRS